MPDRFVRLILGRRWRLEVILAFAAWAASFTVAVWLEAAGIAMVDGMLGFGLVGVAIILVSRMLRQVDYAEALLAVRAGSEAMLQTVIDAIPAPVFFKDRNFRYAGCNQAFEEFLGRPHDAIIGTSVRDVAPSGHAVTYEQADKILFDKGGIQTYEAQVLHADGHERHVLFHKAVFCAADGTKAGIIGVMLDISERHALEERLRLLSSCDPLTGLANHGEFNRRLDETVARAKRIGSRFAVMFLDLDGFKAVNDHLGHQAGDHLLCTVAARLKGVLREIDVVARMGGDEFTLILEKADTASAAETIARKVIDAIRQPVEYGGEQIIVSASVGVALYPHDSTTAQELLTHSDEAMYRAKNSGKNRYCMAVPSFGSDILLDVGL